MRTNLESHLAETAHGAIAESVLSACVHCGLCNATCPTYQITGDELDGPRGRIYLIKQALEGAPVGRLTQVHLDRCLACRACETTCPSGVEYHRLFDVGRQLVSERVSRPWSERLVRWLIRAIVPHPARMSRLVPLARLAGKIPPKVAGGRPPAPVRERRMILLAGCVQSVAAAHFNLATRRVFDRAGITLVEASAAGCCGALSAHLEAPEEARAFARRNIEAWSAELDAGAEAVIVGASGCAAFIRDWPDLLAADPNLAAKARRVAAAVRDPIEILAEANLGPLKTPANRRIAVHDPCTLQHAARLGGRTAALLARLGYEPLPVAEAHLCCGSAGAYSLLQPGFAKRLRADKLAALSAGAPSAIYTANIGCWMHLAETSAVPVRHWIEAVDDLL
ncbi:MAG TPA: glycolate oxidase subunit GlcF [Caulobacteraceae bacterium]|nr:glycolate oxidase subunit GlcF [Caulobacteraceae bacterium]